jgi:ribosomal protein S18 acetylase RimI-like enzyme
VIRRLRDVPGDVTLGTELVREYVVATAEETGQDVELILSIVPDLADFAGRYLRGGAFLVDEKQTESRPAVEVRGAVGITPGPDGTCEMNRLWIRPVHRRAGVARALCEAALEAGRELGFGRMALDVVPERSRAIALYRSLGFEDAPARHEYPFAMVPLARRL